MPTNFNHRTPDIMGCPVSEVAREVDELFSLELGDLIL